MKCKLCEVLANETPLCKYEDFAIFKTRDMKGHHKRIMIVSIDHYETVDEK